MERNKQIALRALTGAFVDRDPAVVAQYFAPNYIQHNPSIPDGPAPIPGLIANLGKDFSYEPGMVVAEGDLVMVHGRYVGWAEADRRSRHIPSGRRQARRALGRDAGKSARPRHSQWQSDVLPAGSRVTSAHKSQQIVLAARPRGDPMLDDF